jgi:hypothetical protein
MKSALLVAIAIAVAALLWFIIADLVAAGCVR